MERITSATPREARRGHEFRYRLAAGYLEPDDVVVDAACGSGYGKDILCRYDDVFYVGVDRDLSYVHADGQFITADLHTWTPTFGFDMFIGFETIEHLDNYQHYVDVAKRARRLILMSVPTVPTCHENPYHRHDFGPGDLAELIVNDAWECWQTVDQPSELSEICVFGRR